MLGMLKAMRTTLAHLPKRKITEQYPEQRFPLPERSRGLFSVVINPATDEARCRACTLCETNCPVQVIRVNYRNTYDLPVVNQARIERVRLAAQKDVDLALLTSVIDQHYEQGTGLIALMQDTQSIYGYLPRAALQELSLHTGVSLSQIYGVATFYNQFRFQPPGKYHVQVCRGTACHVKGSLSVLEAVKRALSVEPGQTTRDGMFSLEVVACIGACGLAPVICINGEFHAKVTPDSIKIILEEYRTKAVDHAQQ